MSQYATLAQFYAMGLRQDAVPSGADVTGVLVAVSSLIDSAAQEGGYTPPFTTWTGSMTLNACKLAAYEVLSTDGFNPDQSSHDKNVLARWEQALEWLKRLAKGEEPLVGAVDSSTSSASSGLETFAVETQDPRGWDFGLVTAEDE